MEILKRGKTKPYDPSYIFICRRCGCVFKALQNECKVEPYRSSSIISHECPTAECGNTVYGSPCGEIAEVTHKK